MATEQPGQQDPGPGRAVSGDASRAGPQGSGGGVAHRQGTACTPPPGADTPELPAQPEPGAGHHQQHTGEAMTSTGAGAAGVRAQVRTRDGWAVQHAVLTVTDM